MPIFLGGFWREQSQKKQHSDTKNLRLTQEKMVYAKPNIPIIANGEIRAFVDVDKGAHVHSGAITYFTTKDYDARFCEHFQCRSHWEARIKVSRFTEEDLKFGFKVFCVTEEDLKFLASQSFLALSTAPSWLSGYPNMPKH